MSFLVANQRANRSFPMTSREHPVAEPYTNPLPNASFGHVFRQSLG